MSPPQTLLKKKFPSSTAVLCLFLQQSVNSTKCGWKSAICVGLVQHNELHQNQFQQEKLRPKPLPLAVPRLKQHQRPDCNEPGNQPTNQPTKPSHCQRALTNNTSNRNINGESWSKIILLENLCLILFKLTWNKFLSVGV